MLSFQKPLLGEHITPKNQMKTSIINPIKPKTQICNQCSDCRRK